MTPPDRQAEPDYSRGPGAARSGFDPSQARPDGEFAPSANGPTGSAAEPTQALRRAPTAARARPSRGALGGGAPSALWALLVLAAVAGASALIVSEFSTLYRVTVATVTKASVVGHHQHDYSLLVIGVAALVLSWGSARRALPATGALVVMGALAVWLGPLSDAHDVSSTGLIGQLYENAAAHAGLGYRLELVGAILLLVGAVGQLVLALPGRSGQRVSRRMWPRPRRRPDPAAASRDGAGDRADTPDRPAGATLADNPFAVETEGRAETRWPPDR